MMTFSLSREEIELPTDIALHFAVFVDREGLAEIVAAYDEALLSANTVRRMLEYWLLLLSSPDFLGQRVEDFNLMSREEQDALLRIASGGVSERAFEDVVNAIIDHASRQADAVALEFEDRTMSYAELAARVDSVASRLVELGLSGCFIGVCLEPGFDIHLALLGAMRAGAVYVPLDPAHPQQRIDLILDDVKPDLVITQASLAERFEGCATDVTTVAELSASRASGQPPSVSPEQPAYVFYTSGTTGMPKGIVATRANLSHYVGEAVDKYAMTADERMLSVARYTFSISLFELLAPLFCGGTVHLLPREHVLDIGRLADAIARSTMFHIGPSLIRPLLQHLELTGTQDTRFNRVRHASSGGDMVTPDVIDGLTRFFPQAEVYVIYGCSEISCMGCTYFVQRDVPVQKTFVGRAFPNVTASIRDESMRLVPVDVVGEIVFTGPGLVRGYLNRDELTSERFFDLEGNRAYRTGDMGRVDRDGNIEILGREDFQVQIRGMRIELGEIDATLKRAPGIRDAVATAAPDPDGNLEIIAFIVMDDIERLADARRFLREWLPDYMLPAHYQRLEKIPVNHNFKIDRSALPDPDPDMFLKAAALDGDSPDITDPIAQQVADAAGEVLGVPVRSLLSNFFDLGGDSLSAMRLILDLERRFAVRVYWLDLIRQPLQSIAEACGAAADVRQLPESVDTSCAGRGFFFGPDRTLYGQWHAKPGGVEQAVLIVQPLGHEYMRARLIVQRLSETLAANGAACVRYDAFACGDSAGDFEAVGVNRWCEDFNAALAYLIERTPGVPITVVSCASASLLLGSQLDLSNVDELVLFDPVSDGAAFIDDAVAAERELWRSNIAIRGWSALWSRNRKHDEVLGFAYNPGMLSDLRNRRADVRGIADLRIREFLSRPERHAAWANPVATEKYRAPLAWLDPSDMVSSIPETGVVSGLAKMILKDRAAPEHAQ
ncbi:MAG: amino acid adenylation domain-containing protein [Pseudomonadota bacterium]